MNILTVVHFGLSCLSACWHVNWRFDIFDIVVIDFVTDPCFQWLTYGAQLPYRTVSWEATVRLKGVEQPVTVDLLRMQRWHQACASFACVRSRDWS